MNPQYTNVKVEGPSFPTKGQPLFEGFLFFETDVFVVFLFVS